MKIDKKTLETMAALPDEQFAALIKLVASSVGISLKTGGMTHEETERLRAVISSLSDNDIVRATEIYDRYKNGG